MPGIPARVSLLIPLTVLTMAAAAPLDAQAQGQSLVIASGLDNPRGLAFGPNGLLYVVEAGRGGTSTLCLPNPTGPGTACHGPSGAVTEISGVGVQQRVLTGLPSLAPPSGANATGPHDIDFAFDSAWITIGGGNPNLRAPFEQAGVHLGSLRRVLFNGQWSDVADLSSVEATSNPAGDDVNSNPYGLAVLSNRAVVADAGANALLQVDAALTVSPLAVFPQRMVPGPGGNAIPMQSVPTCVVEAPDGSLYVGELTGFPFPVGGARIYRVPSGGGTPVVIAEGFTNIVDLAVGPDGSTYVLEHDADGVAAPGTVGRLTKIGLFGSRTELASGTLQKPGGLAIGADNAVYVTTNSNSPGVGQVVRIAQ
jgi:hypothetical protein